jgi:hypothetical protein
MPDQAVKPSSTWSRPWRALKAQRSLGLPYPQISRTVLVSNLRDGNMKTAIVSVLLLALNTVLAGTETNRAFIHQPAAVPGTVWQNGRVRGSYSASGNGGWTYRENGRTVATFTPSAAGGTLWQDGRVLGSYSSNANGWTYRENGKTVATFSTSHGGGGTLWQNGRTAGSYGASGDRGWTYRADGKVVATFSPTGGMRPSDTKPDEKRGRAPVKPNTSPRP